jgi:hypothetical protein
MNYEKLIQQGEQAAESQIENIKRLIAHPFRRKLMKWAQR